MKKYYKYIVTGVLFALFLSLILPSFAATFNETRRAIISPLANAVYGSLSVRDGMYLNYDKDLVKGVFFLEIGQRPMFFWDLANKYHAFQNQTLTLNTISYVTNNDVSLGGTNVFTIYEMNVPDGNFVSQDMFFHPNGTGVTMQGNDTKFFANYNTADFRILLNLGDMTTDFVTYAYNLNFIKGNTGNGVVIKDLFLRDYGVQTDPSNANSIVPFPSPRLMLYTASAGSSSSMSSDVIYQNEGFSTTLALQEVKRKAPKSYYGGWQVVGTTGHGIYIGSCPTTDRCYTKKYSSGGAKTDNPSGGGSTSITYDNWDTEFKCAGSVWNNNPSSGSSYDPEDVDSCYDYQLVQVPTQLYYETDGTSLAWNKPVFDSNGATYEFKVQEVLQMNDDDANYHLVSQNPKFRVTGSDEKAVAISTDVKAGWGVKPVSVHFLHSVIVDGKTKNISAGGLQKVSDKADYNETCFTLCGGKLCPHNIAYVKETRQGDAFNNRTTDPGYEPITPATSQAGKMFVFTYTVGFCPKTSYDDSTYTSSDYEMNYLSSKRDDLLTGLVYGPNYQAPKICLRRKVKCNSINEEQSKARSYWLLTAK